MKLCWIVVLVGISIILVFLYSLVAMSSRSERFEWVCENFEATQKQLEEN